MAWYPGARKMELQPESDAQAAIRPTQFILHSIAAPWTVRRIYEYWRDSTSLESHFGLAYDGDLGQFIGTGTRADANMYANVRAVSIETASNNEHTDPWTPAQLEQLVLLGVWLNKTHGIPAKIPASWDSPGMGYHSMFPQWSDGGTDCPGSARRQQFHSHILPEIQRRLSAPESKDALDMTPEDVKSLVKQAIEEERATLVKDQIYWFGKLFDDTPVEGDENTIWQVTRIREAVKAFFGK